MSIKLGEICNFQSGGTPSKNNSEFFDGTIPWVTTTALNGSKIDERNAATWITEKAIKESAAKIVPANSIMVGTRVGVGKVAVNTVEMSTSQDIISLIDINEERWDKDYLCKFLQSKSDYLNSQARGATIKGIKINVLAELAVPDISVKEQCRISEVLNTVTKLINARQQQLAKLDELVKARFVEMFSDTRAEEPLATLCTFIDYRGKTPEKAERGLPFITAKNIKMHHMSFETKEFISKETYDKVMTRGFPKVGDVVFTTEAPLGNVCRIPYMKTEFYIGQRIITMQTKALEPVYLEYALSSDDFKRKILEKSSGSTVTGIRSKLLEQLTIPVPPIAQQQKFAAFVGQIEKIRLFIQKNIEKIETLKKALMQKYFE